MALEVGQKFTKEMIVNEKNVVSAISDTIKFDVLATPFLIALVEDACNSSLLPHLEKGYASVGVHVDIFHTAATPIGHRVWVESELTEIDGRKVTFSVTAFDDVNGEVGFGTHERFIVNLERFAKKNG
ncbi:MAG: thioesterase family protein [Oscillospiraceae bacterium]|nr:thioesterase family protein [Oscillospiraceae bacterium]